MFVGCAGVGDGSSNATADAGAHDPRIIVTRAGGRNPPSCAARGAAVRMVRFVAALNQADRRALRPAWGAGFKWFSVTGPHRHSHRDDFVAFSRQRAMRYLRWDRRSRVRLKEVDVQRLQSRNAHHVGVSYQGRWKAGTGAWNPMQGKGELRCSSPTIAVWSMALAPPHHGLGSHLCPKPHRRYPRNTVIACVRKD